MIRHRFQLNPITQRRWRRFRRHRRAFWSFGILLLLYGLSLGAELLCNSRPLLVRFNNQWFFPVFRFYPEDTFTGSGRQTRPDYRRLHETTLFSEEAGNWMLFAPVPYDPYESLDPDTLIDQQLATLTLQPVPRVSNVNLDEALQIRRHTAAEPFFPDAGETLIGHPVRATWEIPTEVQQAIRTRFANQAAPALRKQIQATDASRPPIEVALAAYRPRTQPPETVRVTFREAHSEAMTVQTLTLDQDGSIHSDVPAIWNRIASATRSNLLMLARQSFTGPVYPAPIDIENTEHRVTIRRNDVSWPHPPVRGHWLGIDSAGRDVLARILYGLRISMTFAFLLVTASMTLGSLIGAVQGYYGGRIDILGQRAIEIWSALPFLYVIILLGSVYGPGFGLLLLCYAAFNWIGISYYVRAEFLRLRRQPFVEAARCLGIPNRKIILRHILPNALTPVITFFPFSLVGAIGVLAALDYLGFGLPPPTPSWGELLHQAQQFRWAWWLILYPSAALFIVILLGVFVGEGVREAYDPRPPCKLE